MLDARLGLRAAVYVYVLTCRRASMTQPDPLELTSLKDSQREKGRGGSPERALPLPLLLLRGQARSPPRISRGTPHGESREERGREGANDEHH